MKTPKVKQMIINKQMRLPNILTGRWIPITKLLVMITHFLRWTPITQKTPFYEETGRIYETFMKNMN